ncbi:uncharacterized protein TRIADDRAFT_62496 [Trichoplax adhaerens]|uniref:Uncharacterized protein n=1 Tax=Trichoplax adhaerens TaxID=10228 RepID=B3SDZ3_TRIAD|nr:predicted protein [Trichoplax adhaerens]EDV19051.1 predicted protein [Trichoplax adhaerens]|eukprot:XP_002118462.1 predicted protein [Trichoplax adhaerens]
MHDDDGDNQEYYPIMVVKEKTDCNIDCPLLLYCPLFRMPYGIDSINPTSNKDSFFANPFQQPATIDHGNMDTSDDLMMAIQQDEAQFEQLKRKLESDRKDVADQLEKPVVLPPSPANPILID